MDNETYARKFVWGDETEEEQVLRHTNALAIMERYGENHWWESEDDRVYAYYQIHEDVYLSEHPARLGETLSVLLGRPLLPREIELHPANLTLLREEATRAYEQGSPAYTVDEIQSLLSRIIERVRAWEAREGVWNELTIVETE